MLSRTAEHLYWMSRNIERAEAIARFLDVSNRASVTGGGDRESWRTVLTIAGGAQAYGESQGDINGVRVVNWTVLDSSNPSSIYSCLRNVRENAHAVRSVIPNELWEAINSTWIEARSIDGTRLREQGLAAFCEWVKERSHLARGTTLGTMLRDEAFYFVRLGTFLERADNTARLLGVNASGVTAANRVAKASEQLHWASVLKSVSAYRAYRALNRDDVNPAGVADLLILNADMPRSLHNCLNEISEILERIGHGYECTRMAGAEHARLHYGRLEHLLEPGLDAFIAQFLMAANGLGAQVHSDFLMAAA